MPESYSNDGHSANRFFTADVPGGWSAPVESWQSEAPGTVASVENAARGTGDQTTVVVPGQAETIVVTSAGLSIHDAAGMEHTVSFADASAGDLGFASLKQHIEEILGSYQPLTPPEPPAAALDADAVQ